MVKERWKSRDGKKWKKIYGDGEIGKERWGEGDEKERWVRKMENNM
jgi:hypothetical protein